MTIEYCTTDDVFTLGLSAQAFKTFARPFDGIDGPSGTVRLKAHGFAATDLISFEVTGGGALPTGLSAFTTYAPIVVSADLFHVTGFASFASVGSGWGIALDPLRRVRAHILEVCSEIDQHLTANAPPLVAPYPQVLIGLAARMAARAAVLSLSVENPSYRVAVDRLFERQVKDLEMLEKFREGWPINPRPVDQTDAVENGARASSTRAPIGWTDKGCL